VTRASKKIIHEGKYTAEVSVELIEDDTAWSPEEIVREKRSYRVLRLRNHGDRRPLSHLSDTVATTVCRSAAIPSLRALALSA
jgi:hypothetical protein